MTDHRTKQVILVCIKLSPTFVILNNFSRQHSVSRGPHVLVLRKGDQLPWMEGLWVCQSFFSLVGLVPEDVRRREMKEATSSSVKLGMGTI